MESDTLSQLSEDKIKELAENITRTATPYSVILEHKHRKVMPQLLLGMKRKHSKPQTFSFIHQSTGFW